jgi:hypothetical protein
MYGPPGGVNERKRKIKKGLRQKARRARRRAEREAAAAAAVGNPAPAAGDEELKHSEHDPVHPSDDDSEEDACPSNKADSEGGNDVEERKRMMPLYW